MAIKNALMSRNAGKYCLTSTGTSYLTELVVVFVLPQSCRILCVFVNFYR